MHYYFLDWHLVSYKWVNTSPDFAAPVCMNDNTEDGEWSLYDEGEGKVIWIDLYTSW